MASYNQFDLFCNRPEKCLALRFPDIDETDEEFNQRKEHCNQTNKDNELLNRRSRAIVKKLAERRWALMYLQYLANRVNETHTARIEFSEPLSIENLSLNEPESRSSISPPQSLLYKASVEQHVEVLEQRRRDAQIGMEPSWAALNTLARGLIAGIQNDPQDGDIAFRLFNKESHARFCERRQDIRCSNWLQFDISQCRERKGAERHIKNAPYPTDYISISTSPRRIWNLAIQESVTTDHKIAVIDLRVLKRLGIAYGSTTVDLGFHHYNRTTETGTMFATKHHILVLGWLPFPAILEFLSIKQFGELLEQAQIDTSKDSRNIFLPEYEKKLSFPSILQYLSK